MDEKFEAVYYTQPVPSSLATLTILGLVFDKIYFPGMYIPSEGIDEKELKKEIERIKNLGRRDIETVQLVNSMIFALNNKHLKDFCVFTGKPGNMGILEDGAKELTMELEKLIYGPPPPGFTPTPVGGFAKELPGDSGAAVNGPSWLTYPANALIYSEKRNLPLINDNPNMPVPGLGGQSARDNPKLLSTILAFESIKMILPDFKPLQPEEFPEFREQIKKHVKPFRLNMLKLSKELHQIINNNASIEEVQKEAMVLAETTVYPELEELKHIINTPSQPWYKRLIQFAQYTPEFVADLSSMPSNLAIAKILVRFTQEFGNIRDEQLAKEEQIRKNGLYYLLKIKDRIAK
ncbi:hypothetical protein C0416_01370 [bacterium]|nr:hypothetical protein [bacterium]